MSYIRVAALCLFLNNFSSAPALVFKETLSSELTQDHGGSEDEQNASIRSELRELRSGDPNKVATACEFFQERPETEAGPIVLDLVRRSSQPDERGACALALGRLAPIGASGALEEVASDDSLDADTRVAAIHGLSLLDGIGPAYLMTLLEDHDALVRTAAAYVLCELQTKEAIPGIKKLLSEEDSVMEEGLLTAVSLWPEPFKCDLLQASTDVDTSEDDKILALTALDTMDPGSLSRDDMGELADLVARSLSLPVNHAVAEVLRDSTLDRNRTGKKQFASASEGTNYVASVGATCKPKDRKDKLRYLRDLKPSSLGQYVAVFMLTLVTLFSLSQLVRGSVPQMNESKEHMNEKKENGEQPAFQSRFRDLMRDEAPKLVRDFLFACISACLITVALHLL